MNAVGAKFERLLAPEQMTKRGDKIFSTVTHKFVECPPDLIAGEINRPIVRPASAIVVNNSTQYVIL